MDIHDEPDENFESYASSQTMSDRDCSLRPTDDNTHNQGTTGIWWKCMEMFVGLHMKMQLMIVVTSQNQNFKDRSTCACEDPSWHIGLGSHWQYSQYT